MLTKRLCFSFEKVLIPNLTGTCTVVVVLKIVNNFVTCTDSGIDRANTVDGKKQPLCIVSWHFVLGFV